MNQDFIQWFATLGIGGVLAGFMFMFYRKDIRQYTELWQTVTNQLIILVKEDVASNTRLIAMLENLERNSLRKTDIQDMKQDIKNRVPVIIFLFFTIPALSSCAPRYKIVRIEHVGPVQVEIWHDRKLNQCERRVYLDSYYYHGVVPCQD
jgi:hypothetical protein